MVTALLAVLKESVEALYEEEAEWAFALADLVVGGAVPAILHGADYTNALRTMVRFAPRSGCRPLRTGESRRGRGDLRSG